jgi:PAS domain S-box-containing protein
MTSLASSRSESRAIAAHAPTAPASDLRSYEFLRGIIDAISAHIAILDAGGRVLEVNSAWRRFAVENGYRGTSFGVGESYLNVCDSAAQEGARDACDAAFGIREVLGGRFLEFRTDYRCDLANGPRYYQMRVTRFQIASDWFVVVAHDDITEVKRAEQAVRENEARLRAVLTGASIVLFSIDAAGRFLVSEGDGLRQLGLRDSEVVGHSVFDLYAGLPDVLADIRRALAGESFVSTSSVQGRVWETRYSPRADDAGRCIGTIGAAVDVTDRDATQKELALYRDHLEALVRERTEQLHQSHQLLAQADRLASLGTLAAGLGHDIANLLLPMRCRLDSLEALPSSRPARADIAALREAINLLQELCAGLRLCVMDPATFSEPVPRTDLACWWRQVGMVISRVLPKSVRFVQQVHPGTLWTAIAPHKLAQAVLNLITNAAESTPPGGEVELFLGPAPADPSKVLIRVSDTGCGMTDEVLRHAMEPFFTTKKRGRSTGLGLTLVHAAVTSVGGSIDIRSKPGQGTTVELLLPGAVAPDAPLDACQGTDPAVDGERGEVGVTIADARKRAFLLQVLLAGGYEPAPLDPDEPVPDRLRIWLTEAAPQRLRQAGEFLALGQGRRVLVYGPCPHEWFSIGATHVDESRGLEGVRQALRIGAGIARSPP